MTPRSGAAFQGARPGKFKLRHYQRKKKAPGVEARRLFRTIPSASAPAARRQQSPQRAVLLALAPVASLRRRGAAVVVAAEHGLVLRVHIVVGADRVLALRRTAEDADTGGGDAVLRDGVAGARRVAVRLGAQRG